MNHNPFSHLSLPLTLAVFSLIAPTAAHSQSINKPRGISLISVNEEATDTIGPEATEPSILFQEISDINFIPTLLNKSFIPKVFHGYRKLDRHPIRVPETNFLDGLEVTTYITAPDSTEVEMPLYEGLGYEIPQIEEEVYMQASEVPDVSYIMNYKKPSWLRDAMTSYRIQEDLNYDYMIRNPLAIEYAYWDLPEPPQLEEEDTSFYGFLNKMNLPEIDLSAAVLPDEETVIKRHWLHTAGGALQFSQAFVSSNWYQGGNDYLALLFNFNWNVQLNQVYHPKLLFQSNLSYKLALNSTPKGDYHKYSISEDNFQYNLNLGLKAIKKWYYSFNLLFKTQLLNNYEADSDVMTASFLSPGNLNMGLGMSYSYENKYKTLTFTATISPLSYNLNTCITNKIDHKLYNISPNRKVRNEIGSNAEFNMNWQIASFLNYKTRLFLFSDYHYFLSDWENTFSFAINKFLSTQIFLHLRYDTSAEKAPKWKQFMMREILSFGLSYTFSTVPK